jgi:lysine 6-dehydrogenase
MKALVLGAGGMGRAAAWDLARQPGVRVVRLIDRDHTALAEAERELARLLAPGAATEQPARIEAERFDLAESQGLSGMLQGFDVALSAADYRFNEALTKAAIEAKVHLCDLGGNLFVVERQLALDEEAARRGVTVVPDCGLAPGMAGLLGALGVACLDTADSVAMRVGGLPQQPKPPLGYKLVFSARGLVNEYLEPTEVLRDGEVVRVPSLADVEAIEFPPPFGRLEAFNTSGGASTLPRTLRASVRNVDYKTIRYPGHCAIFAGLAAFGLLSEEPVDGVVPRRLTERLLESKLTDDDTDVVLMRVSVEGMKDGNPMRLVYELIDRHDPDTGHSAMARCTAYPAAAIAYMLGAGAIKRRGVLPGELVVPLEEFLGAVRARGLDVTERWETA